LIKSALGKTNFQVFQNPTIMHFYLRLISLHKADL